MDIRPITPAYAVSAQIDPQDFEAIAKAGFRTVIDNRPCAEIPPSHHAPVMQAAAQAAGLDFVILPLTHATLNTDTAATQREVCENASGPVLAYCASGTRCTIIWALGQATDTAPDVLLEKASAQGYDIGMVRAQLAALYGA